MLSKEEQRKKITDYMRRLGCDTETAEAAANGVVSRDDDFDDRRLCLECQHFINVARCRVYKEPPIWYLLKRCDGFKRKQK